MLTPDSSSKPSHPGRVPRILTGPWGPAFFALPLFGALAAIALSFSVDLPARPYESVSAQVQQLEWRDRFALAQAFLAHAEGMGVAPLEAHDCVREIADGTDLSICLPARADRIAASVLLLEKLASVLARQESIDQGLRSPAGEGDAWDYPEDEVEDEGCPAGRDQGDDAGGGDDDDRSVDGALEV